MPDDSGPLRLTRKNIKHVLTKEGYQVATAGDGLEVIDRLKDQAFDVIITGLKMEQADDMQVLETAKPKNPDTEVISITGYATVPAAVSAIQKGSYHFLAKPLKLDEIKQSLNIVPIDDLSQAIDRVLATVAGNLTVERSLSFAL